jgi:hypothetical protein
MSTTEYGNLLETCVANSLKDIFKDVRRSNRKGGRGGPTASDLVVGNKLQVECKRRAEDSPSITRMWWDKVCKRAAKTGRFPVIVTAGEKVNEAIIHLKMRDFISIISEEQAKAEDAANDY